MTSTLHLWLLLALHAPAVPADASVCFVAPSHATGSCDLAGESVLIAEEEELEEHDDDRLDGGGVGVDRPAVAIPDLAAVTSDRLAPLPAAGDAVARHLARGPPAA